MWFRNLVVCRFATGPLDTAALEEALQRDAFQPCGAMDMQSRGWTSPAPHDESFVHKVGGHLLIGLCTEQRLLPAAVINQYAQERAAEAEEKQGYRPGRKQLREIRERVTDELMPRAFTHRRITRAWIDPAGGWFAVDAGTVTKADEVLEWLRKSMDTIPLSPLRTQIAPGTAMSSWLASGDAPTGLSIDRDCELRAPNEEKSAVRYSHHPLDAKDVREHIADGKQATRLALTWNDCISFVLQDDALIKRLSFLDVLKEQAEQQTDGGEEQFDADFMLMAGELSRFLDDLVAALGGELPPG